MTARLVCPDIVAAGATVSLHASFWDHTVRSSVDSCAFFLRRPDGTEVELVADLSDDRMTATASYDVPEDAVEARWWVAVSTGGTGKKHYEEKSFFVKSRHIVDADPPNDPNQSRVYFGVGTAGITDPATLMALGHADLENTHDWSMTLTPNARHVYVCYPASWDIAVTSQGIGFASKTPRTASLTAYDGTTVSYTVLESANALGDGGTRIYDATENA